VEEPLAQSRVDVWLDIACLYRTRTEAQRAIKSGKVEVNGEMVKAHRLLKVGDEIRISRDAGRVQTVIVLAFVEGHIAKAAARLLYEDRTPPPTPEEIERRRMERILFDGRKPTVRPHSRDRRTLRKLKGVG
jgi:ribosome-associated heat shock protein Hsp15